MAKQKQLEEAVKDIKKQNEKNTFEKTENNQNSEELKEKQKQIDDLFNNVLDEKTKLAVWKIEDSNFEHGVIYRLSVPVSSFKYYNMIVNHSAEDKVPDDFIFDEIDFENFLSFSGKSKARFWISPQSIVRQSTEENY